MMTKALGWLIRTHLGAQLAPRGYALYDNKIVFRVADELFLAIGFNLSRFSDSLTPATVRRAFALARPVD